MTMYFRFVICGFNFVNSTIVDNNSIDLVGGGSKNNIQHISQQNTTFIDLP